MSSMKDLYTEYFPKLVRVLPMGDAHFIAQLYTCQLLPGDAKESIAAKATRADKASFFLGNYIETGFDDDGSNPLFVELLKLMQRSGDLVLKKVASDIDSQIKRSTVLLVIITFVDMMCILCRYDAYRCFCMYIHKCITIAGVLTWMT